MINENTVINALNDLTHKDNASILALLSVLHPTNKCVLLDYDVKMQHHDYPTIGIITILNKIIEESGKKIVPIYNSEPEFELLGFRLKDR